MIAQRAPKDGLSALRLMRAAATYDWITVANEVLPQMEARSEGRQWLTLDLFYEATIVGRLRGGDVVGARALYMRMVSATDRHAGDLRLRLLDAHIRAAERALDR